MSHPSELAAGNAAAGNSVLAHARLFGAALLREPFFHFIALGFAIFLLAEYLESHQTRYRIDIGPAQLQRIALSYQQQFGTQPTSDQLNALLQNYIREEIFYREGQALNLDREDEIVRRRVAQKYEFLQQDLGVGAEPDDKAIRRFYETHKARYTSPARRSFTQAYFSPDRDGEIQAKARAEAALTQIANHGLSRAQALGDAFPGPIDNADLSQAEIARLFGSPELAQQVFAAPPRGWTGPLRSGYGWHLILVTSETPRRLRPLDEVRGQIVADYNDDARQRQNARQYSDLKAKYDITVRGNANVAR